MPSLLLAPTKTGTPFDNTIEINVRGKWCRVPALRTHGKNIIVRGRWIKTAIINAEEWMETEVEDPELCVKELKEQRLPGLRADLFTFSQKLPATVPKYKYPMELDSVAAARTASYKDWWEGLPQETRKNVRRSQKRGVLVRVQPLDDQLIRGIVGVNNDSPIRQGVPFAHYGKTYDQVRIDQSTYLDRSEFICAYLGDELIGFMKIVYRGEIASILQFLPKGSHQDARPANTLIAKAIEVCEAKGLSYLTYGMFNYGNKSDSPLRDFKIRNGFAEVLVPRFYVPLTRWGHFCIKMNLHRGLHAIIPHSLITLGVSARAKWYHFKQTMSRCSSMTERPNRDRQMGRSNPPAGSNT